MRFSRVVRAALSASLLAWACVWLGRCELVARAEADGASTPLEVASPLEAAERGACGSRARDVTLAVTQMSVTDDKVENVARASALVRAAAQQGAQIILLQELFAGPYFPQEQHGRHFARAEDAASSTLLEHFASLAAELRVVLPISFFERAGAAFFNSVAVFDADGSNLGIYRKSHIPDGPGYQEKFYFSPGDTGFKVFDTKHGRIGVAICWDQWFPEAARVMVLQGAEVLLYPTAIGSEPQDPSLVSQGHWQRAMQGHSAANMVPVMASNRIGREAWPESYPPSAITFYGGSFITDHTGEIVMKMGNDEEGFVLACVQLEDMELERRSWGLFRDRRPDLYEAVLSLDGRKQMG